MTIQNSENNHFKKTKEILEKEYGIEFDKMDDETKNFLEKKIRDAIEKEKKERKLADGNIKNTYAQDTYKEVAKNKEINNYIRRKIRIGKIPREEKEVLSVTDIINEIGINYGVDIKDIEKDNNGCIRRQIQRILKDKPDVENSYEKRKQNQARYFSRKIVDDMFGSKEFQEYIKKQIKKNPTYNSNIELLYERIRAFDRMQEEMHKLWESVGLTEEEGKYLELDKVTEKKYLRADELEVLQRKGLQLREELPEEDKKTLKEYEIFLLESESKEKEIERFYREKKMEIMISTLFNEHYSLDEEKLRNDIENYVQNDGIDVAIINEVALKEKGIYPMQSFPIKRITDNLKNSSYYVKKRKKATPKETQENTETGKETQ